jgi:hypothetical protein
MEAPFSLRVDEHADRAFMRGQLPWLDDRANLSGEYAS